jgi:hypothetical protein
MTLGLRHRRISAVPISLAKEIQRSLAAIWAVAACLAVAFALGGCKTDPIVITPSEQIQGVLLKPDGAPVAGKDVTLYQLKKNKLDLTLDGSKSGSDGIFTLNLPRHAAPSPDYAIVARGLADFPFYGFGIGKQVTVDLVSTVVYELIATSPAPITVFTSAQLSTLLDRARKVIIGKVAAHLIQNEATMEQLHTAYHNAIAADDGAQGVLTLFQTYSLLNGMYVGGLLPYGVLNTPPVIPGGGWSPTNGTPQVAEAQTLAMNVSVVDHDGDNVFFSWTAQRISSLCMQPGEVAGGAPIDLGYGNYAFNFSPGYDFAPWQTPNIIYKITVYASDGGKQDSHSWCTNVTNTNRAPVFITEAVRAATEDLLWTYTPRAMSLDGVPLTLFLDNGNPSAPGGATTGPGAMDMCINSTAQSGNYSGAPVWSWQYKGTPCTEPNKITWTPTNCQSIGSQAVRVVAKDQLLTNSIQTFNILVGEINTPPVITSGTGPNAPIATGEEAKPWTYQVYASDRESNPAALPNVAGTNPTPQVLVGGVACADTLTFTLTNGPASAAINPTTGIVTWTPKDQETGLQQFSVLVDDGHGGSARQDFTVQVLNTEQPPSFFYPLPSPTPTPYFLVKEEVNNTDNPFWTNIAVIDPDVADNVAGRVSLSVTNLPPGATISNTDPEDPAAKNYWRLSWPLDDSQTPSTYDVHLTACDANFINSPMGVFTAPTFSVAASGPSHAHLCTPMTIRLDAPKRNIQPEITSASPSLTTATLPYIYNIVAKDGNTTPPDNLTFRLLSPATVPVGPAPPAGLTLTPLTSTAPTATARLNWTPNNTTDVGPHSFAIEVKDSNGFGGAEHTFVQSVSVYVKEFNHSPTITSLCPVAATNGVPLTYTVAGHDTDSQSYNNTLAYSLTSGVNGMSIEKKTGIFTWNPTVAQARVGAASFTVQVKDTGDSPVSAPASQTCNLTLSYVNEAPAFAPMVNPIIAPGKLFSAIISTSDPDGDPVAISAAGLPSGSTLVDQGDGTALFNWTPTALADTTIIFYAQDTYATNLHHTTTFNWVIRSSDTPEWLSHPVTKGSTSGTYVYELHAFDPTDAGLSYHIDSGPSGMTVAKDSNGVWTASWTPSSAFAGNNNVTLRAEASNGRNANQSFVMNVKTSSNALPTVNGTMPDAAGVVAVTEGRVSNFSISVADLDGEPLHYAWYLDGQWQADFSSSFALTPLPDAAGDHKVRVDVTDGTVIVQQEFNVHCRDALPVLGMVKSVPGLRLMGLAPRGRRVAVVNGSNSYQIFDADSLEPIGSPAVLPFAPARMTVQNDLASATFIAAYFSQFGPINVANTYVQVPSDTMAPSACATAFCFGKMYDSAFPSVGGTNTVYKTANNSRFNIDPTNRRMLSSSTAGAPNVNFDLGAGVSAASLVFDPDRNQLFVSDTPAHRILVVNLAGPTISNIVALPASAGTSVLYLNTPAKLLYAYNTGDGSITEISAVSYAVGGTTTGLPAGIGIGTEPAATLIAGNDEDGIIYFVAANGGNWLSYDTLFGTAKLLAIPGGAPSEVIFDTTKKRPFAASATGGKLFYLK